MPCTSELAQLPTPMIATRTLSSERAALPLVDAMCFLSQKLSSNGQDSLEHRQPGGRRQQIDEPLERDAERREDEAARDQDHALGAAADADVSFEADQLGLRPGVGDEEGAGDRCDADGDADVVSGAREHEGDRGEYEALADPVRERVEKLAERRRLVTLPGERTVEDVKDRAGDEEHRGEPVEEELVAVLERNHDRGGDAEENASRGQRIRAHARARDTPDIARGEAPGSVCIALLDGADRCGSVHVPDRSTLLSTQPSQSRQAVDPRR